MCCSESFFNKERFTPSQLPELSVQEFIYLLVSSSHLLESLYIKPYRR